MQRRADGGPDGAGNVFDATVRGPAGYALSAHVSTIETAAPYHARMQLAGDLDGTATWTLVRVEPGTEVVLLLDVEVTRPWMRTVSRLARPLFEWSHGIVVRHAVEAAAHRIDARVLSFSSTAEPPPRARRGS